MPVIVDAIDRSSATFATNRDDLQARVAQLREIVEEVAVGGGEASRERHIGRGKLLPRERVRLLLDPGSPFLELSQLAAKSMYDDAVPAASIITDIGCVLGRECVVIANKATVKGGN